MTDEDNKALFHFLVEQLKALIKVIKPKKYRINARLGFEDPATMGKGSCLCFNLFMVCQVLTFL